MKRFKAENLKFNNFFRLLSMRKASRVRSLSIVTLIAIVGTLMLVLARAAPATLSVEPESIIRTPNAQRIDNDPGASGNSSVRFGSAGSTNPPGGTGKRCTISISGAGQFNDGLPDSFDGSGFHIITPAKPMTANGQGRETFWLYDGPHNFQYDPATGNTEYTTLRNYIASFIDSRGCGPTIISSGSNGGAFAAKMYCRGEDFGGRVWAYYVGDPVMDDGVLNCSPSTNIQKTMFTHSTELRDQAAGVAPGYRCSDLQWTWYCENDRTRSVATYQTEIGQISYHTSTTHGGADLMPDKYAGAVLGTWWCTWIKDYTTEPLGANCSWVGVNR